MALRPVIFLAFLFFAAEPRAQVVTSQSSQFVIHGQKPVVWDKVPEGFMLVQPELLAVTAERVRDAAVAEIPALGAARTPIHITIVANAKPKTPIGIVATKFTDGWTYQVALPPVVDEAQLVKALVQILMVRFANLAEGHNVELPNWVVEGFTQKLFFSVGPKLVVDQNPIGWQITVKDLQFRTREALRTNAAPTFQELTMSIPPAPDTPLENLYQSSAHLLVSSMLDMPNGRNRFAAFLQRLRSAWNWQTAFRETFGFQRMLDIEKWWALATLEFSSRDQRQAWPLELSLRKLDELLKTRVEVRAAAESLPQSQQVDLNSLLHEENWFLQRQALSEKISQLNYTMPHFAPVVAALAADYRKTLQAYVQKRNRPGSSAGLRSTPEAQKQIAITDALRRIQALDQKRRSLAQPTLSSNR